MKFINLLKKELSELINKQMIISLVIMLGIFFLMGNFMKSATEELKDDIVNPKVNICDMDDTELTGEMIASFKTNGSEVKNITVNGEDYAAAFKDSDIKSFVVIPKGFTETLEKGEKPEILSVSKIKGTSAFSNMTGGTENASSLINDYVSRKIAEQQGVTDDELDIIGSPMPITEHTVVADKSAKVSSSAIMSKLLSQNMILPIIILVLLMFTSQTLIASISNEKIDKTLETLLSAPVSRGSVITAKMLAAAIVALLNAAVMMIGFTSYVSSMAESVTSDSELTSAITSALSTGDAFSQLGLTLSAVDYIFVGIQLFTTIMICLAISIVLGALVDDSKSAQTALMPIMILVMVPWMVTMLADINSLPMAAKCLIYAIPFTHTFNAMPNLMFGNTTEFWLGFGYQLVIFFVVMYFALSLFKSDKILTISLNLGQRSKFKKTSKTNED